MVRVASLSWRHFRRGLGGEPEPGMGHSPGTKLKEVAAGPVASEQDRFGVLSKLKGTEGEGEEARGKGHTSTVRILTRDPVSMLFAFHTPSLSWELDFDVALLRSPALGCGLFLDFFSLLILFEAFYSCSQKLRQGVLYLLPN